MGRLHAPGSGLNYNTVVFSVSCISENDIAAESVRAENFSATDSAGKIACVTDAYYYADSREIKLTILADEAEVNKNFTISSCTLKDIDGTTVDFSAEAAAFREENAEFNSIGAVGYIFKKNDEYTIDIAGKTGVVTIIRIINSTGSSVSGTVELYDNDNLCGEAQFAVNSEAAVYVEVDTSAHCFSGTENISCRFVLN